MKYTHFFPLTPFKTNFPPSKIGWISPKITTFTGPLRFCTYPKIFRSNNVKKHTLKNINKTNRNKIEKRIKDPLWDPQNPYYSDSVLGYTLETWIWYVTPPSWSLTLCDINATLSLWLNRLLILFAVNRSLLLSYLENLSLRGKYYFWLPKHQSLNNKYILIFKKHTPEWNKPLIRWNTTSIRLPPPLSQSPLST